MESKAVEDLKDILEDPQAVALINQSTRASEGKFSERNIEYYLNQDEIDEDDKFSAFNEWCAREGLHMPKL
jgi:hypothetical protein